MATTQRNYILLASILSAIAVVISIVSLATRQWVVSDKVTWKVIQEKRVDINYGLFNGELEGPIPNVHSTISLSMTCLFSHNICLMACGSNADNLLEMLYNKQHFKVTEPKDCGLHMEQQQLLKLQDSGNDNNIRFISAGAWVCTILFLALSISSGIIACSVALYNFLSNPYQLPFSLVAVCVYASVGCFSSLLVLLIWGIMFAVDTTHNIGLIFSQPNLMDSSDGLSRLGYSYWLNILTILLYVAVVTSLYIRHRQVSRDPVQKMIEKENTVDPEIYSF